jgi:hypothetical protein
MQELTPAAVYQAAAHQLLAAARRGVFLEPVVPMVYAGYLIVHVGPNRRQRRAAAAMLRRMKGRMR